MGTSVENSHVGPHFTGAVFEGFALHLHRVTPPIDEWSQGASYPKLKAAVNAARTGTDAALDAAAADAWGTWWADKVVAKGLRDQYRSTLARYLPLDIPLP